MATDSAPNTRSYRRNYWQLPTFALGIAAALTAYAKFPPPPTDPAVLFSKQVTELRQTLDRRPLDMAALDKLTHQIAADADKYPNLSPQACYLAGSGYLLMAEAKPADADLWTLAAAYLTRVEPNQLTDTADQKKLIFRRAKAQAAQGTGDPATVATTIAVVPPGEESEGERYRLLADASLRMTPPDSKRAKDALTAYLTGPSKLPASTLARYRLKLAEIHLVMNEPDRARTWLKEIGAGASPEVQASARAQLARLAAAENNWPEAVKLYETALGTSGIPDDQRSLLCFQIGNGYVQMRNAPAAVPYFEKALKDPGPISPAAAVRLAEILVRDPAQRGNRAKAVELLETAVRGVPSGSEFRSPFLSVEEVRAVFEETIQVCILETEFGSAIRATAAYSSVAVPGRDREKRAEVNMAWGTFLQKTPATLTQAPPRFKQAADDYLGLATNYPTAAGKADLLNRAADCFRKAGDTPSASTVLEQIIRTPGLPETAVAAAWYEKGEILLTSARTEEAVTALQKAMAMPSPVMAKARVKLAVAHLEQARQGGPDSKKMMEFAQNLLAQSANSPADSATDREAQEQALFELGKLLLQQGSVPDAEARFRQLVQTHPTGRLAGQGKLYLGSCLLLLARGDHQGGRPPADSDRKLAEAAKLFEELSDSSDSFLKTQADIRLANTTLLLKKYDDMPTLCEKLASRYRGRVEELIVLSMLYSSYRFADRPEPAARTLSQMEEVFNRLSPTEFRGGAEEYTREYWVKQWFDPLRKKP